MGFKIKLDVYEGPMDLLLYLVKKDELDIMDIPIARIANEYLEYVKLMRLLDLALAAEFVLMAATLMRIKVQSLLPNPQPDEDEEDPRLELQQRLIEYKKYKDVAARLGRREEAARDYFPRTYPLPSEEVHEQEAGVSLFDLLTAFRAVLEKRKEIDIYEVEAPIQSVEERMEEILSHLSEKKGVRFSKLFVSHSTKLDLIVTFLAILELIRLQRIRVSQRKAFGEITLRLAHSRK